MKITFTAPRVPSQVNGVDMQPGYAVSIDTPDDLDLELLVDVLRQAALSARAHGVEPVTASWSIAP